MFQEGVRPCWFCFVSPVEQIEVASLDDLYLLLVDADMTLVAIINVLSCVNLDSRYYIIYIYI